MDTENLGLLALLYGLDIAKALSHQSENFIEECILEMVRNKHEFLQNLSQIIKQDLVSSNIAQVSQKYKLPQEILIVLSFQLISNIKKRERSEEKPDKNAEFTYQKKGSQSDKVNKQNDRNEYLSIKKQKVNKQSEEVNSDNQASEVDQKSTTGKEKNQDLARDLPTNESLEQQKQNLMAQKQENSKTVDQEVKNEQGDIKDRQQIKNQALQEIQQGVKIDQVAQKYNIKSSTIKAWISLNKNKVQLIQWRKLSFQVTFVLSLR